MEIQANFENGFFKVYDSEERVIGKIKIDPKANFEKSEIIIGDKNYQVIRENWETKIFENNKPIYHLKTSSFSGNTKIIELNKTIKGVWGLKWGTQLSDKDGNSLLKIRNEKKIVNNGSYVIKLENQDLKPMEILISFYGHLYGSSLKQQSVLVGIMAGSSI